MDSKCVIVNGQRTCWLRIAVHRKREDKIVQLSVAKIVLGAKNGDLEVNALNQGS